jgi:hypothetical protein
MFCQRKLIKRSPRLSLNSEVVLTYQEKECSVDDEQRDDTR